MAPRFVVTGTGRHGSGYTAALFNACGIPCGHEGWWTVPGTPVNPTLVGDSSWLAVPDLLGSSWTEPNLVILQVRHPLDVVGSLLKAPDGGLYHAHRSKLVPEHHDPVLRAVDAWTRWNRAALKLLALGEQDVWRLEDGIGIEQVQWVAELLGVPWSQPRTGTEPGFGSKRPTCLTTRSSATCGTWRPCSTTERPDHDR
jgi:hypothetical protein